MIDPFWQNIFKRDNKKDSHIRLTIKQVPIFETLSKRELASVENILHTRKYLKGETIFKENTPGLGMYIILNGEISINGQDTGGSKMEFAHLSNGDFFGEISLIDDSNRSATAMAFTDCELAAFFRDDLMDIITKTPKTGNKILLNLANVISRRLKHTNDLLRQQSGEYHTEAL
ncbi:MAG: cyclic nucleotide-binding domain-containing protein [Fidelibacterota bacterium]